MGNRGFILELDHQQHKEGEHYTQEKEQTRERLLLAHFAQQPGPPATAFLRLNEHHFVDNRRARYQATGERGNVVELEERVDRVWEEMRKVVEGRKEMPGITYFYYDG